MGDYNVLSYYAGMPGGWSLDDVGLPLEGATASLAMRAMRWCEHKAVDMLEEILADRHDPTRPWHMDETNDPERGLLPESWWLIVPESALYPPLPDAAGEEAAV